MPGEVVSPLLFLKGDAFRGFGEEGFGQGFLGFLERRFGRRLAEEKGEGP
jgi:hypothetical protein